MIKVNYDLNGNIIGFYPDDIQYTTIPEPYIEIDKVTHQDCIDNPGRRKVDTVNKVIVTYTPPAPTPDEIKVVKLSVLDTEYDPQFDGLTLAWATASMDGDTTTAAARLADKTALKAEYQTKRTAILNG